MKKTRKVWHSLLVGTVGLTLVLSGCSKSGGASSASPSGSAAGTASATPSASSESAANLPPVKLVMHLGVSEQKDQAKVFEKANEIIQKKINATVDFRYHGFGTYSDQMNVIVASGEPYDIAFTSNWTNDYVQNVNKGAYAPLDDLLPQYGKSLLADVDQKYWDATKVNGKIYAVPNIQIEATSPGIWLQKDLVDKTGFKVDEMKTIKDIEPFMKAAKEQSGALTWGLDASRLADLSGWSYIHDFHIPGAVNLNDPDLKVFNQFESPEYADLINTNRDWYQKGYLYKDLSADGNSLIKAKKISWSWLGTYKPGVEAEASSGNGFEVAVKQLGQPITSSNNVRATMFAVSSTSKNPERAVMLLDLINSDKELYNLLVFGIQDVHYKKVGDNRIEPIADSGYTTDGGWAFGNTFHAYLLPGQPDDVWDQTKKLNESAKVSPLSGFIFNTEPVKVEVANCTKVWNEMHLLVESGQLDPNVTLPKFLDKLKKAGSDKIIAEMQKQVDAFKAAKK